MGGRVSHTVTASRDEIKIQEGGKNPPSCILLNEVKNSNPLSLKILEARALA